MALVVFVGASFVAAWSWGDHLSCLPEAPGSVRTNWFAPGEALDKCFAIGISHEYRTYQLPSGETLKKFALGYDKALADLMFVYVIGVMDWHETQPAFFDWTHKMAMAISLLHPKYAFVYYSLGTYLSYEHETIPLSNDIFERGMKELPDDFNMPFYIAFNYYWELKDKKSAAPYFAEACRRPTAPPHMCTLAAKLMLEEKGDPEEIAQLVALGYCTNASPRRAEIIRVDLESRILPKIEDPVVRNRVRARFERQIALCQARFEQKR